jgi:hypothetical protein
MGERTFRAVVAVEGGKAVLRLPFEPEEAWGARARHDITGTLAGHALRGKVQRDARGAFLALGPTWRRDNGVEVGDDVEVTLRLEGPLVDEMPEDLRAAFAADPVARANFEGLTTFCRKNYMRWIDDAKRPETRARRVAELIPMLLRSAEERIKAP